MIQYSFNGLPIPPLKSITFYPSASTLHTPPVKYLGDLKGHIGISNIFFYMIDGELLVTNDDKKFVLRSGQLIFLPSGHFRSYVPLTKDIALYELSVRTEVEGVDLFEYLHLNDGNYLVNIPKEEEKEFRTYFEKIARAEYSDVSTYIDRTVSAAAISYSYIKKRFSAGVKADSMSNVIRFMEANLDKNLTLAEMAASACMQPTYFIRKFKKDYNTSPVSYYNKLRANEALKLLHENAYPTNALIGQAIGIKDPYYFSNFFKKHFGVSPDRYKELMRIH